MEHQLIYIKHLEFSTRCFITESQNIPWAVRFVIFFKFMIKFLNKFKAIIIPHNFLIVNYYLGHSGSVYDTYVFRSACIYQE